MLTRVVPSILLPNLPSHASYYYIPGLQMGGKRDWNRILTFCRYRWKEVKRRLPQLETKRERVLWLYSTQKSQSYRSGFASTVNIFHISPGMTAELQTPDFLVRHTHIFSEQNDFPAQTNKNYYIRIHREGPSKFK